MPNDRLPSLCASPALRLGFERPGARGLRMGDATSPRAAGAKLFFLPRYSPDLNPIEQVFAKLKTLLRKTDPRTIETTWRGIDLLDRFTPQECANYLANAGYASA